MVEIVEQHNEEEYVVIINNGGVALHKDLIKKMYDSGIDFYSNNGVTPTYNIYTEDGSAMLAHKLTFDKNGANYEFIGHTTDNDEFFEMLNEEM
ncbi:hypothetical protein IRY55_02480 [Savagea sp. SN6]|uniref:Uncharacterized protein n=1 Tax=Savagea serpentis TaxID=2785297 RepID=A0A8J7G324_9BACL|nr:hypothetical protein [Savagea serpentis]MBF4500216.1 hypothetical protein [Savagea serpentis]MBF4500217.1 hypothetical protein [Savagea serpentis]